MPALENLYEYEYEYGIATKRYQHEHEAPGVSEIREGDKTSYSSFSSTIIEHEDVREISQVQVVSATPDTSEIESEDGKKLPKPA
eukprot:CAMPEP_0194109042 /NCGR_PEP_ID=MMETSP0150-20130528/8641_1 /TAXON_ID=122233 /ORGANISM="Chaetoceros debilis, Strain MM31A-1" /LENGTH=84 /DNA_ID=CAMNT_0038797911 /DNA_START=191 /DNA_END=442 /DNA_ORIENTATION=+